MILQLQVFLFLFIYYSFLQVTHLCYGLILLQELLGFMLHCQMVFQLWVPDTRQPQLNQTMLIVQHG